MQRRLIALGAVFTFLIVVAGAMIALSLGGDEGANVEDAAVSDESGNVEDALSAMTLQPNDLPSGFVLQEERFYTRDQLLQELPATAQAAEEGLQYALHRRFTTDDASPQQVDVLIYVYEDAAAAIAGHEYLRGDQGIMAIPRRLNGGQEPHDYEARFDSDPELGEDSVVAYVTLNALTSSPQQAQVFGMRYANVRAEVAAVVHAGFAYVPDDAAQSQLLRIQEGSLTSDR